MNQALDIFKVQTEKKKKEFTKHEEEKEKKNIYIYGMDHTHLDRPSLSIQLNLFNCSPLIFFFFGFNGLIYFC